MAVALNEILSSKHFLKRLKEAGSQGGMRFKEYRELCVRLHNGIDVEITTPYFLKAAPKRGRKKKDPAGAVDIGV